LYNTKKAVFHSETSVLYEGIDLGQGHPPSNAFEIHICKEGNPPVALWGANMNFENIIAAFVTAFSLVLFLISLNSYRRARKMRILIICVAFLLFFIKGLVMTVALFYFVTLQSQIAYLSIIDVVILIMLFVAVSVQK